MEIWHRVYFNPIRASEFLLLLDTLQIKYRGAFHPDGTRNIIYFNMTESNNNWTQIHELMKIYNIPSRNDTYFSDDEILNSEWLRLIPTFENGYPQPEKTWVRNPVNYSDFCLNCGTFKQVSPFRIKHEPKNLKYDFQSSPWAWVFFCSKSVINSLQKNGIKGYEDWDIILHGLNNTSKIYSQLYAPNLAQPGLLDSESLRPETCHVCNNTKYYAHLRGVMRYKKDAVDQNLDIMQTNEWFGGGGKSAYKETLISNKLAKLIIESGWKGVRMKVVELA